MGVLGVLRAVGGYGLGLRVWRAVRVRVSDLGLSFSFKFAAVVGRA